MRYSPVFHLEDFFDRYSDLGQSFDGAHISFANILVDPTQETYTGHDLYAPRTSISLPSNSTMNESPVVTKRKHSAASRKKHLDLKLSHRNGHAESVLLTPSGSTHDRNLSMHQQQHSMLDPTNTPMTPFPPNGNGMPSLSQTPFSPPYSFSSLQQPESYDPMFGMSQMGYGFGNGMGGGMSVGVGANEGMTPGARSAGESTGTEGEKDPFLSLLEQLAENEHSRGGPSELDFFLSGGNG
jgi:hypothetical protein